MENIIKISRDEITKPHSPKEWYEIFSNPDFDKEYFYSENDLGMTYTKSKTIIKVWAPTASKITILLYKTGNVKDDFLFEEHPLNYVSKGTWQVYLEGDYKNLYYVFKIECNGKIYITNDPYGIGCGVNGKRSMILDIKETAPHEWEKDNHVFHHLDQTIIYELHINDISICPSSGVKPEYRGKFLALTQNNTCLNNDETKPTCLNYIKKLGVTTIQIMPMYDYGSVDEEKKDEYNWGYDPVNYNVPEGSYSTNPENGLVRIKELKQMIQSLHNEGISVIMDVVYNHTYSFENSNLNCTCPFYYYRQEPDGTICNGSGCGNDTASERSMFRQFVKKSILFWINEYHVDGFRFDLMGLHDINLMNEIRELVDEKFGEGKIIIYGEPWSCGKTHLSNSNLKLANKNNVNYFNENIGFFNDDLRNIVKGSEFIPNDRGFLFFNNTTDTERINDFKMYFTGKIDESIPQDNLIPRQLINYISCHDNYTLWDKLVNSLYKIKEKKTEASLYTEKNEKLIKLNKLGASIILLSFGVPFILSGEEAGRTKLGNDNSYNLSTQINQIDWERVYLFEDLLKYYQELIKLRKELSNFYQLKRANFQYLTNLSENGIGFVLKRMNYGKYKDIIIIFNFSDEPLEYNLKGNWKILLNSGNNIKKNLSNEKMFLNGKESIVFGKEN